MDYPKDFIEEVKAAYPSFKELHSLLDEGAVIVGRYLDDFSSNSISIDKILAATSLEELQAAANVQKERLALYNWWCRLYSNS